MKLLEDNADCTLLEHVRFLEERHDMWRCIYLNFNNVKLKNGEDLKEHFVVDHIEEILSDVDGEIFVCTDGDVFILFQGALRPVISKLSAHFKGIMPQVLWKQPEDDIFTIFDLSKYWQLFFSLCKAKYQKWHEKADMVWEGAPLEQSLLPPEAIAKQLSAAVAAEQQPETH